MQTVSMTALFLKRLRIGSKCAGEPPHDEGSTICGSSWSCGTVLAAGPGLIETAEL